ncbi:MAG: hypothetical protein KatS3mg131_3598 [Candidatus Tectimicrobiota bacterium]|nr:MAG: hypothetical protein KatS3mg131_3598 [Candidatus Tectomicrobia bacterium]
MKLTDALRGEHGVFYAQFAHLQEQAAAPAQVREQVALLAAALQTHARLEEELLFAALEPHLGPMGPLAVMRMEHDEIDTGLAALQQVEEAKAARQQLERLLQLAREHFTKEEHVLFALAEQYLDGKALTRLGEQWAARRGVHLA